MVEKTLIEAKRYLQTGSHIGAKFKSKGMARFIFKKRRDKLKVLDVSTIDQRLRMAAQFLSSFNPERVAAVSRKEYGIPGVEKFAKLTGAKPYTKRFVPGTFTNPAARHFFEPEAVLVTDPKIDAQAVKEAAEIRVPVVALCSTDNATTNVDLVIPINNKGRTSIALAFYLLSREVLLARGELKDESAFTEEMDSFEFKMSDHPRTPPKRFRSPRRGRGSRGRGRGPRK